MTVSSSTRRAGPFNGNDVATAFPFTFKVFSASDVAVYVTDPDGVQELLGSNYSVTLNGDQDTSPGGTINYPTAGDPLADGYTLDVIGSVAYTQGTDLTNLGRFQPNVIERALDKITFLIQQLLEKFARTISFPVGDTAENTLPTATARAGKAMIFDDDGGVTVSTDDYESHLALVTAQAQIATSAAAAAAASEEDAEQAERNAEAIVLGNFLQDGAGAVARTFPDKVREAISLTDFLMVSQREAVRTNNFAGVDMTVFTAAVQAAIDAAQGHVLEIPTPAFIKVNRPLVWKEITVIQGLGTPNLSLGVVFYPDLSVDWPSLYPDQGVLTCDKYLFGYAGYGSITAGFWTGLGRNFQVRAELDAANYAAHRSRVPDYGVVIWAPNESVFMEHVQVLNFKKGNWLCAGISSVPTFLHCTGFSAGAGQDTTFGDAVTRAASAFGAAVNVYWNVNNSTTVFLEAAAATDLDTLAPGDILTINGAAHTVATVPAATAAITERTVIAGVETTARHYRRITVNVAANFNGRIYPAGISFRNHPNLTFAPGVAGAAGGRGNSGSARLLGFSGDNNAALVFLDGAQTLAIVSPKSEANNSLVHISGNANGGARGRVDVSGYRADGYGTADTGLIRITASARPSVVLGTGQLVGYTYALNDQTSVGGAEQLTAASFYGQGFLHYCKDNTEIPSFSKARIGELTVGDGGVSGIMTVVDGGDSANRRMSWKVQNATDIYTLSVGAGPATVFSVGANTGSNAYLWAYNGAATEKIVRMFNQGGAAAVMIGQSAAQKVGFFGVNPVVQQASAPVAADLATAITLANAMRTALQNLGLIA